MSPESLRSVQAALRDADTVPGLTIGAYTITPDLARALLEDGRRAGRNFRTVRKAKVAQYIADMTAGHWRLTGEPLVFDKYGVLLNGEHRLRSCSEGEVPFDSVIVLGVEPEVVRNMDTGAVRSLGDYLRMEGYDDAKSLAASIGTAYQYETFGVIEHTSFSIDTLLDWFKDGHEGLVEDLAAVRKWAVKDIPGITPSILAPIRHLSDGLYPVEEVDGFFAEIYYGEDITPRSVTRLMREFFIKRSASKTASGRIQRPMVFAILVNALNLWMAGEEVTKVSRILWRPGGRHPQPFPTIGNADLETAQEMDLAAV